MPLQKKNSVIHPKIFKPSIVSHNRVWPLMASRTSLSKSVGPFLTWALKVTTIQNNALTANGRQVLHYTVGDSFQVDVHCGAHTDDWFRKQFHGRLVQIRVILWEYCGKHAKHLSSAVDDIPCHIFERLREILQRVLGEIHLHYSQKVGQLIHDKPSIVWHIFL